MRKGMTATQTIVALAVGLIVLVGLGYLVWTWIGKGGGEVSETYCRSKAFAYCTEMQVKGLLDGLDGTAFVGQYPGCDSYGWAHDVDEGYCNSVLSTG
jgi:hypothetical protein